jgi:DNA-binding response OmpR family regulator
MGDSAAPLAVVVEDDADVRHLLRAILVRAGFEVVLTEDGVEGVEAVRRHDPVLTTLDVDMPGLDGFSAAQQIREFSSTYIIMLTGLADETDVVRGLDSGADDYLVKPFRPRELRARIDSVMRRPRHHVDVAPAVGGAGDERTALPPRRGDDGAWEDVPVGDGFRGGGGDAVAPAHRPAPAPADHGIGRAHGLPTTGGTREDDAWLRCNGLAVDVERRVVVVDGRTVDLTRTEFDLVASLVSTGRRVRSKADLVLTLRGQNYVTTYFVNEADKRAVEVHMADIRRKLGDSSTTPRWIEIVRGVGYRMAEEG